MNKVEAEAIAGSLGSPSKMPGYSYGLPAEECQTGRRLVGVKGSVCDGCYALKGFYQTYAKTIKPAQYKRLASIQSAQWIDAMVTLISLAAKRSRFFRWHDSGDIQSVEHLDKIVTIAQYLPDVAFWLPTREYRIIQEYLSQHNEGFPHNLIVRLSAHMVDGPVPYIAGLPVSSVFTAQVPDGARECPARFQKNNCGDCRACWDREIPHISYNAH